jgi:predicted amidophosphoribosyltransferase
MVQGTHSEVREMIWQTAEYEASHTAGSGARIRVGELLAIYEIDDPARQPHDTILVLDDMLTKGTHFRAMKAKILEHFPGKRVVGVFIARAVHAGVSASDFDVLA